MPIKERTKVAHANTSAAWFRSAMHVPYCVKRAQATNHLWTGGSELVIVDAIAPLGERATLIREIEPQLRAMKGAGNGQ